VDILSCFGVNDFQTRAYTTCQRTVEELELGVAGPSTVFATPNYVTTIPGEASMKVSNNSSEEKKQMDGLPYLYS